MPQAIRINKAYAEYVIECIRTGKPIEPPTADRWTQLDQISVACALCFAAWSHRPAIPQPDLDSDQQTEADQDHIKDVVAAIDFVSVVHSHVADDKYDEYYEPEMEAVVYADGKLAPGRGWKIAEPDDE